MPYPILETTSQAVTHPAAHNSVIDVKAHFGATGDGTTNDAAAIQAAIDALPATGGAVVFPPGTYKLDTGLTITTNKSIVLSGYGALLKPAASVIALTINQATGDTARGCTVEGLFFDGSLGTGDTAVQLKNTDRATLRDVRIKDFTTGVHLLSTTSGGWVEGTALENVFVSTCVTGIKFEKTGSGTGSFGETNFKQVGVQGSTTGVDIGVGSNLYRSKFGGLTIWQDATSTGLSINGDMFQAQGLVSLETTSPTATTGVVVGASATNTTRMDVTFNWTGTFTNNYTVAAGKTFIWRDAAGVTKAANNGGDFRFYKAFLGTESDERVAIAGEFSGGGGIMFGGGGVADTNLYRSAADRLKSDDLIDATLMGVATFVKAGAPTDADWAVAPPVGTLVVDTTNNKIWARTAAATWKGVVIA